MRYSTIKADPLTGEVIGRLYLSADPTVTPLARLAYQAFAAQVDTQFTALLGRVRVEFTDVDPYGSFEELSADVEGNRHLAVWRTQADQTHPVLTPEQNDRFRAVHDYYGHCLSGRGFDRHGEEAAWVRHSTMFTGLARRAMTSETRGQSSAFIWINGGREFPPQKAVILPEWVSRIPLGYFR